MDIIKSNLARTLQQTKDNIICLAESTKVRTFEIGEELFIRNFRIS